MIIKIKEKNYHSEHLFEHFYVNMAFTSKLKILL